MSSNEKRSTVFTNLIAHLPQAERLEFEDFLKQKLQTHTKLAGGVENEKWSEQLRLFKLLKRWDFRSFTYEELLTEFPDTNHGTLTHELSRSLKLFLACKQLEDDQLTVDLMVLNRLSLRHSPEAFEHYWKHSYKDLKEDGGRGGYFFSRSLELLRTYQEHLSSINNSGPNAQNIFPELQAIMEQREAFDAVHLRILEANFARIYQGGAYKDSFDPSKLEIVTASPAAHEGLTLYRLLLEFLKDGSNAANFEVIRKQMTKCTQLKSFSDAEFKEVYGWVTNYLIKAFQQSGNSKDALPLFEIYRDGYKNGYLKIGDSVPGRYFKSACSAGFRAVPAAQVIAFAKEILKEVKEEGGDGFKLFYDLERTFFEEKFPEVLDTIGKLPSDQLKAIFDPNLKLQMLTIELKALYHLAVLDGKRSPGFAKPKLSEIREKTRKFKEKVSKFKGLRSYHHDSFLNWATYFQELLAMEAHTREENRLDLLEDFIRRVRVAPLMDDKWWLLNAAERRKQKEI